MKAEPRTGRALIDATRAFTAEDAGRSRWALVSTLVFFAATTGATFFVKNPLLRGAIATVSGLLIVRLFVLFHDTMHGALFRKSPLERWVMSLFAYATLTPPKVWRETHNYHHAHTAKLIGSHIGSFPMVTPSLWAMMSRTQRIRYALARHPITIVFAYFTIFMWGMCLGPFVRAPRKNLQGAITLAVNLAITAALIARFDFVTFVFAYGYPLALATALGGYLFYAQHNFPGAVVQPRESWTFTRAALESSSFMEMGPVLRYFTGDIGFHHVHHLNSHIPFYRLEEAMNAIDELKSPAKTSLHPRDVWQCLRLAMWNPEKMRMTAWAEPSAAEGAAGATGTASN